MKDLNQIPAAELHQANSEALNAKSSPSLVNFFLDDWPAPPKCQEGPDDSSSSLEVRRWRVQILLAVNPYGIPSLKFGEAFERMFGRKFELRDYGYDNLDDMLNNMTDIFVVQQPDEITAALFPEYPHDRILHDARLGHNFAKPNIDGDDQLAPTSRLQANGTSSKCDFNDLIIKAWIDRDEEFPPDVVLAGESYEQLWRISAASIPGTKGVYHATMVSVANPETILLKLKSNDEEQGRISGLSDEIDQYFKQTKHSIEAYSVPREFILPGFPCLSYLGKQRIWERCIVVGRFRNENKVLVESIDFGGLYSVALISLYLIPRQFLDIPRQTLQVSLLGLKSVENEEWPSKVGARMRCFSYEQYYLDVLLLEPRIKPSRLDSIDLGSDSSIKNLTSAVSSMTVADGTKSQGSNTPKPSSSKKKKSMNTIAYEAIIVDRNDKEMDLFLDEILMLETYATQADDQVEEISRIKEQLRQVLPSIPRPINPFEE